MLTQNYTIICVTESCLTDENDSTDLLLTDVKKCRADRPSYGNKTSPHGRILIAVKQTINSKVSFDNLSDCCLQRFIHFGLDDLTVKVFYSPPSGSPYRYSAAEFNALLGAVPTMENSMRSVVQRQ